MKRIFRLRQTKNGKERRVLLTPRALAVLGDRCLGLAPETPIFPTVARKRPWRLRTAFRRACVRAGVTGLRIHDLRHTFATRLVTGGADLVTVQHLLGHADLRMTGRYAHPTGASMQQAVEILKTRREAPHKNPHTKRKRVAAVGRNPLTCLVEGRGFEPPTSALRTRRSPN